MAALDQAEAQTQDRAGREVPIAPRDPIRITRLETLLVKPRWLFLKVHTNAGIVGLGEPIVEGRALTVPRPSRRSSPTSSARTRARSSTTGRRSTGTPSTAAGRFSPAP